MGATLKFNLPSGLIALNPENVNAKITDFIAAGPDKLHLVTDWDRTITANGGGRDITSWGVVQSLLPPEGQVIDNTLYELYQPKELGGTMSESEALLWWQESLALHVRYGTNVHDVETAVAKVGMLPRKGAKSSKDQEGLFDVCTRLHIPTIILSAGVRSVIECVTRRYDISPTAILATNLRIADDGCIIGWDEKTLIHNFNKHERGHEELAAIRRDRPKAILLGDSNDDAQMVAGTNNVLRIRIYDKPINSSSAYVDKLSKASIAVGYDLLVEGSFLPVVKLIQLMSEPGRN